MMQLGERDLTVKRTAPGTFTDGDLVDGAVTTLTIRGTVRPVSGGRELERVPEGVRARATHVLFHNTGPGAPNTERLKIGGAPGTTQISDRVTFDDGSGTQDLEVLALVDNADPFGLVGATTLSHREYVLGAPRHPAYTVS